MSRLMVFRSLWLVPLVLALSACDMFIPVPVPAPSSIPVFQPSATTTATLPPTITPPATPTPSPAPYLTATPAPCDHASLVSAVSAPPGIHMQPGTPFTQTWGIRNDSPCTWTPGFQLVNVSGDNLGGPVSMRIPYLVIPGAEINLSLDLIAPCNVGTYFDYWVVQDMDGIDFGVGSRSFPLLVLIQVTGRPIEPACTPPPTGR